MEYYEHKKLAKVRVKLALVVKCSFTAFIFPLQNLKIKAQQQVQPKLVEIDKQLERFGYS